MRILLLEICALTACSSAREAPHPQTPAEPPSIAIALQPVDAPPASALPPATPGLTGATVTRYELDAKPQFSVSFKVQITPSGREHTLRWYADRGRLYWITITADGSHLRVSEDGDHFTLLELPPDAGSPSDLLRAGEHLFVLAERGLYELGEGRFMLRVPIPETKTPFSVDDAYCAPPMAVFNGALYVGDQRRGALWKLVAD
jgi:hypothetical protein